MPLASHRIRYIVLALILTWMGLVLFTRPAHGAWSAEPVQVHATTALCPAVSAVGDGHAGAIIVWQENTASGGLLRARHLLEDGELDPAWSTPAAVSDRDAARPGIGAVTDGAGGAYIWWMEGTSLLLNHLAADGSIAPGWSTHGRTLGRLPTIENRPAAVADGQGGVYVGWLTRSMLMVDPVVSIRVARLGPSGTGAGGWPASGRAFGLVDAEASVSAFGLDLADDGGLWLAWQTITKGPMGSNLPGELIALRLAPTSLPATGWTGDGVVLAPYDPSFMNDATGWLDLPVFPSQVAIARDAGTGAFVVSSQGAPLDFNIVFHNRLRHIDAVGGPAEGWVAEGVDLGDVFTVGDPMPGADASLRAVADAHGGVFAGLPQFGSEGSARMSFGRRSADGEPLPGGVGADQQGIELAARDDGGLFIASFKPSGASGPYEADAYIAVTQSEPGDGFFESSRSLSAIRYGDIGLTATGDGGAIFAWSQLIDRQGIFAIRLGRSGAVTGVPPARTIGAPSLRARFVRGEGVHAVATFSGASHVRLALHDVTGRRVSSLTSEATLGADVVLPGTRELPGGVYFATASDGTGLLRAKLVVIR